MSYEPREMPTRTDYTDYDAAIDALLGDDNALHIDLTADSHADSHIDLTADSHADSSGWSTADVSADLSTDSNTDPSADSNTDPSADPSADLSAKIDYVDVDNVASIDVDMDALTRKIRSLPQQNFRHTTQHMPLPPRHQSTPQWWLSHVESQCKRYSLSNTSLSQDSTMRDRHRDGAIRSNETIHTTNTRTLERRMDDIDRKLDRLLHMVEVGMNIA